MLPDAPFGSSVRVTAAVLLGTLFLACASTRPLTGRSAASYAMIPDFQHERSEKTADCLAVCADMVLRFYGVDHSVSDSAYPLEMMEFSNSLNSGETVNSSGHILFSAVLGMTVSDIISQLEKQRPLIIAYRPSASQEYHSVVVTGADTSGKRFYISDPARSKPVWKKVSKFPTYSNTGRLLVMVIGLREN